MKHQITVLGESDITFILFTFSSALDYYVLEPGYTEPRIRYKIHATIDFKISSRYLFL
jgi:hypothetical protein